jgi:hypothetical protein
MHNLRLTGARFDGVEEVVRWLGGVQSQDYGPAKWSVAQRTSGVGDAEIERAFAAGAILRTHVLRPTWHFVLPADIRWMLELTGPRVQMMNAYRYRQLELDEATLGRCSGLLVGALQGGNGLTRRELQAVLERDGVVTDGQRMAYILMNAELNGIICSGGLRGKQQTYALLDERAPRARSLSKDEALAELTVRYFTSHGPATVKDFRWWSSLTVAEIKQGLELVRSQLEQEIIDGVAYWFAAPASSSEPPSPTVHLLQGYDEYLVGYSESKYVLDRSGAARSRPADRGNFNLVVILDSQVGGHWKRTLKRSGVTIEAALYAPFDDAQREALQAAADRHGEFLGLPGAVVKVVS